MKTIYKNKTRLKHSKTCIRYINRLYSKNNPDPSLGSYRLLNLPWRVLSLSLKVDGRSILHDPLNWHLDKFIKGVQLLPYETLLIKIRAEKIKQIHTITISGEWKWIHILTLIPVPAETEHVHWLIWWFTFGKLTVLFNLQSEWHERWVTWWRSNRPPATDLGWFHHHPHHIDYLLRTISDKSLETEAAAHEWCSTSPLKQA